MMDVDEQRDYYDDRGGARRRNRDGGDGGGDRHHPYGNDEEGGRRGRGGGRGGRGGDRGGGDHHRGGGGRGGRGGRGPRDDGALSFRDFCYKYLRDDTTPAEAERRYEEYQKENQEAFFERYFRDHRHDQNERARNDPRVLVETLKARDDLSLTRAQEFFAAHADGSLVVYGATEGDENEDANMDGDDAKGDDTAAGVRPPKKRSPAPIECWNPRRLGFDFKQAGRLINALDQEKGIEGNPLLDGDEAAASMDVEDDAAATAEDVAALQALGADESTVARLDERLCYLLRVHGIDYYRRCQEMNPVTFLERITMDSAWTQRDPKPEGTVGDMSENPYAVKWAMATDNHVKRRIAEGDPQVKKLGTAEIEAKLEEWIQSCVVKHDEQRFGCTLSSKLFLAEEFVLKHIRNKQAHHVADMQERLLDEQYKKNVIEYLKYEEHKKSSRSNRRNNMFGGGMMMMTVPGPDGNGQMIQVPGGARAIAGMARYTDLDASVAERVVIDYGDI